MIHTAMGDLDTFYLNCAPELLGQRLKALGTDADVTMFPGKDHGSVLTPELRSIRQKQMTAAFLKYFTRAARRSEAAALGMS